MASNLQEYQNVLAKFAGTERMRTSVRSSVLQERQFRHIKDIGFRGRGRLTAKSLKEKTQLTIACNNLASEYSDKVGPESDPEKNFVDEITTDGAIIQLLIDDIKRQDPTAVFE